MAVTAHAGTPFTTVSTWPFVPAEDKPVPPFATPNMPVVIFEASRLGISAVTILRNEGGDPGAATGEAGPAKNLFSSWVARDTANVPLVVTGEEATVKSEGIESPTDVTVPTLPAAGVCHVALPTASEVSTLPVPAVGEYRSTPANIAKTSSGPSPKAAILGTEKPLPKLRTSELIVICFEAEMVCCEIKESLIVPVAENKASLPVVPDPPIPLAGARHAGYGRKNSSIGTD